MKTKISDPNHEFLRRPCVKCDEMFRPTTKHNAVCSFCRDKFEEWRLKSGKRSLKDYEEYKKNERK